VTSTGVFGLASVGVVVYCEIDSVAVLAIALAAFESFFEAKANV
jgi:hypothetical protein